MLDPRTCYQALRTRDERFDGRLFVGVLSTGIYCRPVCPAKPARLENCRFFASAAAAQQAGFRPCLRCRPETAPDAGSWRGTSNTVQRGLALIAQGELDGDDASVEALAERLGVGGRQLRRLFQQHLGASPLSVAQTRRVLFAKELIHDTHLPMGEIALAAGFGSIRRYNETFQQLYGRPPSALRDKRAATWADGSVAATGVTVRLRYRPPYDWTQVLAHLRARAVEGVECVDGATYRRTVRQDGATGTIEVAHLPERRSLSARVRFPSVRSLTGIVARIRRVFDLGADVTTIGAHLAVDPLLGPLVAQRPGVRVPGGWDGFETAVRAVLGQQVSVKAARGLVGQLAALCGTRMLRDQSDDPSLMLAFPDAAQVASADLRPLRVPRARRQALTELARAAAADPHLFDPQDTVELTVTKLRAIPGIGEWTAQYIALRAAREPDAFPAGDAGLLRSATRLAGAAVSAAELARRAERWRPWRGYAAQHLWSAPDDRDSRAADAIAHEKEAS
jgi:AraC family transcriptional regulator of adaptative response / DNA-3-methyladenine glycosylase II